MERLRSLKLFGLLAITLVAASLRLYKIDVLPPGAGYDAAYYGLDALAILRAEWPIFFESNFGRESLFSYLVAACVALFGVGSLAIHLASAIAGIVTIPAVYLVAEDLFAGDGTSLGRFGGLIASLATALSFWHLGWSRYGVRAILTPLFAALTMYLLCRGHETVVGLCREWPLPWSGSVHLSGRTACAGSGDRRGCVRRVDRKTVCQDRPLVSSPRGRCGCSSLCPLGHLFCDPP